MLAIGAVRIYEQRVQYLSNFFSKAMSITDSRYPQSSKFKVCHGINHWDLNPLLLELVEERYHVQIP